MGYDVEIILMRQTASYLTNLFGFSLAGVDQSDGDRVSYLLQQGEVRMTVTGATVRDSSTPLHRSPHRPARR